MASYSKTLEKIANANPNLVTEYYCDSDGHWMYLREGYSWSGMECGTLHEYTVAEALSMLREGVYRDDDQERTLMKIKRK